MQIKLTDQQRRRLGDRISDDMAAAQDQHNVRIQRWKKYYRRFLNLAAPKRAGEEDIPNIRVPVTQEQVILRLAKEINALLGPEAEIIADPVGPSDSRVVHKVSRFMTWRVLRSMKIARPLAEFDFRRILFGRAFAYAPWHEDKYRTAEGWQTYYSGPVFEPIAADDLVLPAVAGACCVHDFHWVIRRHRKTLADLLQGEADDQFSGISKRKDDLRKICYSSDERDDTYDEIIQPQDEAEGVIYSSALARGWQTIPLWQWYGMLDPEDYESDHVVVEYSDDLKEIFSVKSLIEMYPRKRHRVPIVEGSLYPHGAYWGLSFGQMLEQYEEHLSANARLMACAGQFSVGPVLFAKPQSGFGPDQHEYRPFQINWVEDPTSVQQMKFAFDPQYSVLAEQMHRAGVERLTGISDYQAGRDVNRPTAPRTATGLVSLMEAGEVRASLDLRMLHEDVGAMIQHFWELEADLGDPQVFFRVTEEDAAGMIQTRQGGATMTAEEFGGRYDFTLKFAATHQQRQNRKNELLQLYGLCLQNPLFVQYPNALWHVTAKVWKEFTGEDFSAVMPKPPDPGLPKAPREEWVLMLQGEDAMAHPQDDDRAHFIEHGKQLEDEAQAQRPDAAAMAKLQRHIREHREQYAAKQTAVGLVGAIAKQLSGNTPETGGLQMQPPVPVDVMQLQEQMAGLIPQGGMNGSAKQSVTGNQ